MSNIRGGHNEVYNFCCSNSRIFSINNVNLSIVGHILVISLQTKQALNAFLKNE